MTHSEAFREAMANIRANAAAYREGSISEADAHRNLYGILKAYDRQVASIDPGAILEQHQHDFSIP